MGKLSGLHCLDDLRSTAVLYIQILKAYFVDDVVDLSALFPKACSAPLLFRLLNELGQHQCQTNRRWAKERGGGGG